jgi:hypothetical protein
MEKPRSYTGEADTNIDSSQIVPTTTLKLTMSLVTKEKVFEFVTNLSGMVYETNPVRHVQSSDEWLQLETYLTIDKVCDSD